MSADRKTFIHWGELLRELQLATLALLSLIDLEYFSYASWDSRALYSVAVDKHFRPEINRFYQRLRISQPIPPNAFLTPSTLGKGTFVLTKGMAAVLEGLVGLLRYSVADQNNRLNFSIFTRNLRDARSNVFDPVRFTHPLQKRDTDNIHVWLPILHWHLSALGLILNDDERKTMLITPETGLPETRELFGYPPLIQRAHDYRILGHPDTEERAQSIEKIETFGSHLSALGLSSLFSRIKSRLQVVTLPEDSPEYSQAMRQAMDERSAFLGTLTPRTWSEKETHAKTALCNNDTKLYVCDKPIAEAYYRRICALSEREAVFIHRALFTEPAAAQQAPAAPQPSHSRFDSANLLQLLTALDEVAKTTDGKAFIQSLFDLNNDANNDYKLAVFKLLLQNYSSAFYPIDTDLFSEQRLADLFKAAVRLQEKYRDHDLDPVVWVSMLLILMSRTLTKRAVHFVDTLLHIRQHYPCDYLSLMQDIRSTLITFVRTELNPDNADILLPFSYLIFTVDIYWLSNNLIPLLSYARANNKHNQFCNLLSLWWGKCVSEEDRALYLPDMQRIAGSSHFSSIVRYFMNRDWNEIAKYHTSIYNICLAVGQSQLLGPDSALWSLSPGNLRELFPDHPFSGHEKFSQPLLYGIAHTNKQRVLSRLQKLGPHFLLLNQLAQYNNESWLFALLFKLPDCLFEAVLLRISPTLNALQDAKSKKGKLEQLFATIVDIPGLVLFLHHGRTNPLYFNESVFDTIPGSVLEALSRVAFIPPLEMKTTKKQIPVQSDLFTFLVRVVNTSQRYPDDREVKAIKVTALADFIVQHAGDETFLAFLRGSDCVYSRDAHLTPDEFMKLEKYRLGQVVGVRRVVEDEQPVARFGF